MNIKKLHFLSGLILTLFIGMHLFNHFMSIFGATTHLEWMDNLRVVYRNTVIEIILLLAVCIQIFSGLKLFFSKRQYVEGFFHKLQIWTGIYLAFFLIIHVGAVMAGRFILELDTNFYFGVAGLNTFPINIFFIPYYSFAIISFFGHLAGIHSQKMKTKFFGLSIAQQSGLILIFGILMSLIILYGLTNGFAGVEIPEAYEILKEKGI